MLSLSINPLTGKADESEGRSCSEGGRSAAWKINFTSVITLYKAGLTFSYNFSGTSLPRVHLLHAL
jgi:hypothetical protein